MAARKNGNGNGSMDAARRAVQQLSMLTGRPIEGVLGMRRCEDDGWDVTLELLEVRRVPDTADVLASYEVSLDKGGELREYRRVRRYARGHVEEA